MKLSESLGANRTEDGKWKPLFVIDSDKERRHRNLNVTRGFLFDFQVGYSLSFWKRVKLNFLPGDDPGRLIFYSDGTTKCIVQIF